MAMLNLYSYNISKSLDLFNEITSFFERKKNSILFLQELPKDLKDDNVLHARFNGKYLYFWHCGLLVLVTLDLSRILGPFQKVDADRYFVAVSCQLGTLINVHMNTICLRDDRIVSYGNEVRKILDVVSSPIIVGGDFNDNPFNTSLSSSEVWFAKRSSKEIKPKKGFVNLFWNLLKLKRNEMPRGTIVAPEGGHEPMDVAVFDQFIMKKHYSDKVVSLGVIKKIGNKCITKLNEDYKSSIDGTPHWPIYVSIGGIING